MIEAVQGLTEQASASFEQALAIYRHLGHHSKVNGLLGNLAAHANRAGDYEQGARYAREACELARQHGDQTPLVHALTCLGTAMGKQGNETQASAIFADALSIARTLPYPVLIAGIHNEWGEVSLHHQQVEAAERHFQDLLTMSLAPQTPSPWRSWAQWGMARVALYRGELTEARHLAESSMETLHTMQDGLADTICAWLNKLPASDPPPQRQPGDV